MDEDEIERLKRLGLYDRGQTSKGSVTDKVAASIDRLTTAAAQQVAELKNVGKKLNKLDGIHELQGQLLESLGTGG